MAADAALGVTEETAPTARPQPASRSSQSAHVAKRTSGEREIIHLPLFEHDSSAERWGERLACKDGLEGREQLHALLPKGR